MRVFKATASGNTVFFEGQPVPNCPILGEGMEASEGFIIISEFELVYIPRITPDTKKLIDLINDLSIKIQGALTALKSGYIPADPSQPPLVDAAIQEVAAATEAIVQLKDNLR